MTFESVHTNRSVFNVQFQCMPGVIKHIYLKKVGFLFFSHTPSIRKSIAVRNFILVLS